MHISEVSSTVSTSGAAPCNILKSSFPASERRGDKPASQQLRAVRSLSTPEGYKEAKALNGEIGNEIARMRLGLRPSEFSALMKMGKGKSDDVTPPAMQLKTQNWSQRFAALLFGVHAVATDNSQGVRAGSIKPAEPIRVRRAAGSALATPTALVAPTAPTAFSGATPGNFTIQSFSPMPIASPILPSSTSAPVSASTSAFDSDLKMLALAPDWIDEINFLAFDEVAFFTECGVQTDLGDGLPGRLRAMFECFAPYLDLHKQLPLDISRLNPEKIARFVAGVMGTIGPNNPPYPEGDPAFSRNLFKRWFLESASPLSGSLNGGLSRSPFHDALLRMTHPSSLHRQRCSNGDRSEVASSLPRIGDLKKELQDLYFRSFGHREGAAAREWNAAREWVFRSLCQVFEQTLLRDELPAAFRYGSLSWALLSIGIDVAGDEHVAMSTHALISLGAASSSHFFMDSDDRAAPTFSQKSIEIILRMAHVQGKIDLLDRHGVSERTIETARDFFITQLSAEKEKLAPLEQLIGKVPTRQAVARETLRENGIDPDRLFFLSNEKDGFAGTKRLHRVECSVDPDRCMPATLLYMEGKLDQLRQRGALSRHEAALPDLSALTLSRLSDDFKRRFDAAFAPLAHEIMVPALQDQVELMDAESEEFWRCAEYDGEWTVSIPTTRIETEQPDRGIVRGRVGVVGQTSSAISYQAQDSVLIRLALGQGAAQKVQTYWVTLEPFEVRRYRVNDKALLGSEFRRFFKPARAGETLLRLNGRASISYEIHDASGSNSLFQTVSECLLKHRKSILQEAAYQITESEQLKERLLENMKSLLPLYSCIKGSMAGDRAAAIHCTLDALSMFPPIAAGARLSKGMFVTGSRMTVRNMRGAARAFVANVVNKSSAHQSVRTVLTLGKPALSTARAGVNLIDPGFGLLYGITKLPFQLGPLAWRKLKNVIGRSAELQGFVARLEKAEQLALKCYPDRGFWRARPETVTRINGRRSMVADGKTYEIGKVGETPDVLMLRDGGRLRLANPQSGRGYGPVIASAAVAWQDRGDALLEKFKAAFMASCRSKRAGDVIQPCNLVPDARFGPHGYGRRSAEQIKFYQMQLSGIAPEQPAPLRTIDAIDLGYSTWVETPSGGRSHITPDSFVQFVHRADGLNGPQSRLRLPRIINAQIRSLPAKDGGAMVDYAAFTMNRRDDLTGAIIHVSHYVPLATYRERNGPVVAVAFCDPWTAYSVEIDPAIMPLAGPHPAIVLKPATADQMKKFSKFQSLQAYDAHAANSITAGAVQLIDETAAVKEKFELVFHRAGEMLDDAIHVMEDLQLQPAVVRMASKLLGIQDEQAVRSQINAFWTQLTAMQKDLPYLREQSPHVIGFFDGAGTRNGVTVTASTIQKSMEIPLSFQELNQPLIAFDRQYFMGRPEDVNVGKLDEDSGTLAHESGHALYGWSDLMHRDAAAPVYALSAGGEVNLSPITAAAKLPDSQPANHAPTIEHFMVMAAYLRHEGTRASVMRYINSPNVHGYTRTTSDIEADHLMAIVAAMDMRGERRRRDRV